MKYLLILFALLLVAGCDKQNSSYTTDAKEVLVITDIHGRQIIQMVYLIDSCEYLGPPTLDINQWEVSFTHKGNCNNPEHRKH